jgi:hypothetical protein
MNTATYFSTLDQAYAFAQGVRLVADLRAQANIDITVIACVGHGFRVDVQCPVAAGAVIAHVPQVATPVRPRHFIG